VAGVETQAAKAGAKATPRGDDEDSGEDTFPEDDDEEDDSSSDEETRPTAELKGAFGG
jgi:hypothetical protein